MLTRGRLFAALLCLVALCAWLPGPTSRAGGPAGNRKVHFLVLGAADDERIGAGIGHNLEVVARLHQGIPEERRGVLRVVDRISADVVRRQVAELADVVDPADAVFCYVACHGAYDENFGGNDPSGGHFFALPGGDLLRRDLWQRLKGLDARLTVLVTDTCNAPGLAMPAPATELPAAFARMDSPKWRVLTALFVQPEGDVDISGSSTDQFGWFQGPLPGGWFTYHFVNAACDPPFARPDEVTWDQFLTPVVSGTSTFFQNRRAEILENPGGMAEGTLALLRGQRDQRPQFFRLHIGRPERLAGSYFIRNVYTGKQLDLAAIEGKPDGSKVRGWGFNNQTNQLWRLRADGDGQYRLENVWAGLYLDAVYLEGHPNGATVAGYKANGLHNQLWVVERLGENRYRFQNRFTRKYLDMAIVEDNPDDAEVYGWELNGQENQMWTLERVGD